jgi:hypothetical protein
LRTQFLCQNEKTGGTASSWSDYLQVFAVLESAENDSEKDKSERQDRVTSIRVRAMMSHVGAIPVVWN